ncbi:RNA polymerase sigma factor [Bacillus sp. 31A1R]|uniref:RNA polymerase sigma factor n=1 Tax=Robertmurraya mangrovi TaxID=3098077 RepID=A0ABU5IW64_9BACI|nr:RNA polymerase sigma factor [Bacillus sp. 31A1R]MDZ5471382.1 RNA polymerase sigma factor [Bacillus sp. 31A1R]
MDAGRQIEQWFYEYEIDILNYLIYYTGMRDVEDLVQDTFLRAFNAFHSYRSDANPRTWLISIARNTAIDHFRKKSLWEKVKRTLIADQNENESTLTDQLLLMEEEYAYLYQSISSLKQSYKEVVLLKGIAELSSEETANVLGWSVNKVNVTFHRAVKKLNLIMKEEGSNGTLDEQRSS